jgi:hypothetical protein
MLHALALVCAALAAGFMAAAVLGMVTGRMGARAGWALRALSVLCFAAAVALNVAAH